MPDGRPPGYSRYDFRMAPRASRSWGSCAEAGMVIPRTLSEMSGIEENSSASFYDFDDGEGDSYPLPPNLMPVPLLESDEGEGERETQL